MCLDWQVYAYYFGSMTFPLDPPVYENWNVVMSRVPDVGRPTEERESTVTCHVPVYRQ